MKKLYNVLVIAVITVCFFGIYAFIHEGGHALAALIFGGEITEFDFNFINGYPHASYRGDFSTYQSAVMSLVGPVIPILSWFIAFMYLKHNKNLIVQKSIAVSSIGILGSWVPNLLLPIVYELGGDAGNEDIVKFIINLNINGFVMAFVNLILFVLMCYMVFKEISFKEILSKQIEVKAKNKKQTIWTGALLVFLIVIIVLTSSNLLNGAINGRSTFKPPSDYEHLLEFDLGNYEEGSVLYSIEVKEPRVYDITTLGESKEMVTLTLKSNHTLHGMRRNEIPLYSKKGKSKGMIGWYLDKGIYDIVLSQGGTGDEVDIYINTRDLTPGTFMYTNEEIFNDRIPNPDNGYELVYEGKLEDASDKTLYDFQIDKEKNVLFTIFLTTETGTATVKLVGDHYEDRLINDYQISTDGRGSYLKEGDYTLTLTSDGCDGKIYIFMKVLE